MLIVRAFGDNLFEVENESIKIKGYAKALDEYMISYKIIEHYSKGKNNRWYKTKELLEHNSKWFTYILSENGFISKTVTLK